MMRGGAFGLTSTNYLTLSLYNNSIIGELIVVWYAEIVSDSFGGRPAAIIPGALGNASSLGGTAGIIQPLVAGEAQLPGVVNYLDDAAQIDPSGITMQDGNVITGCLTGLPNAILRTGYSFAIQDTTTGATLSNAMFIWQVVHNADLEGKHCDICDEILVI